jgi:hypothetical protein
MRNLDLISQLGKGEWIVDICHNVRLAHSSICTFHDNADRIKESAKSGTKVFAYVARLLQSYQNEPYQQTSVGVLCVSIALKINSIELYTYCMYSTYILLLIYLLTFLLTPWSRVLLEKLTGFQLVKKFPAFYGT